MHIDVKLPPDNRDWNFKTADQWAKETGWDAAKIHEIQANALWYAAMLDAQLNGVNHSNTLIWVSAQVEHNLPVDRLATGAATASP